MLRILIFLACCLITIHGHGYLYEPVARSSAWLVDSSFRQCCTWPQHMEMFCGGLGHQWNVNGLSSFLFHLESEYLNSFSFIQMASVASVVKPTINR